MGGLVLALALGWLPLSRGSPAGHDALRSALRAEVPPPDSHVLALANPRVPLAVGQIVGLPKPDDRRRRIEEWTARGDRELETGDARAALKAYEQGLALAEQLDDASLVARSLSKLAGIYLDHLNESQKGTRLAGEALSAARRAGNRREEAWALNQVGSGYFAAGDFVKALESFEAVLPMMKEVGDDLGEGEALKNVGIAYRFLGRFEEALESLHQAVDRFRQLKATRSTLSALANLGMVYANVGAYELAFDTYKQGLRIADGAQIPEETTELLTRMGFLYLDLNDDPHAFEQFSRARAIAEEHKLPGIGWVLNGLSEVLVRLGNLDPAIELGRETLRISRQRNDWLGTVNDLRDLAEVYLDRDPAVAIGYLHEAFTMLQGRDSPLIWSIYATLGRAYRRAGDLDRAIEVDYQAADRLEHFRSAFASDDYKATFLSKHTSTYQDLIEALMERPQRLSDVSDEARAFGISERARARAMVEAIADARLDLGRELEPDLRQREQQINTRLSGLQRRLLEPRVALEERQSVLDELTQTEAAFDRLVVDIKRRNPRYAARQYPDPLSLERTQASLDRSSALLAYSLTEHHVFAFLVTSATFHAVPLAASPRIVAARVQNYLDLIAQDARAGWQATSQRLDEELVAPLRPYLPHEITRLIIIPDGVLHYLPFETLMRDGRYLLEDFTISYAPSATVLSELRSARTAVAAAERADLLIVADPALTVALGKPSASRLPTEATRALYDDEGLQVEPIPFSAAEASAIARYARRGTVVYLGADASEHRIKTDPLDRFRVIHFATHALISERTPARSALVLARTPGDNEDGFLQAREIYQLKLKSDLVVLSACQTARGRMQAGEGIQGLARAFLYAGAQAVLVSLWNVNDERTATLMAAFYRHLADGQSKADALRAAKLDLLRSGTTAAPRYWAPFILIGDADVPVPISGPPWWLRTDRRTMVGVVLALALLASLVLVRARGR